MKKATIKNWAYMMTVMAATPSVPIQAMRMRLNTTVMMLEARLVTISEAPLAQLRSSTEKSQRGRVKQRPPRLRKKNQSPPTAGIQYPMAVASAAPAMPICSGTMKR